MTVFPEHEVLGYIVELLEQHDGSARLEEIERQLSRTETVRLPPRELDLLVRTTIRANGGGQGLGCFARPD
jgi:hypothetical protein